MLRIPVGTRVFAPTWLMTALTAMLFVLFVSLGRWQWDRGTLRQAQWSEFERASGATADARELQRMERFQRIRATGEFDVARQVLLDNRTHAGRAGYEVLTPLRLTDGRIVLVNRGWVPFTGYREQLPDIRFKPPVPVTVTGRADDLPVAGISRGRIEPGPQRAWPKVASFPTVQQLSEAYGQRVEPRMLLLDPGEPDGYVREWKPPGMEPARHFSYAVQWWSFAALIIVLWLVMSLRGRSV